MVRQRLVLNNNFGDFVGHALAGSQVKRYARPTPVINVGLNRHKGFSIAVGALASVFVEISGHGLAVDNTLAVLPSDNVILHAGSIDGAKCLDDLDLLVTNAFSLE